METKLDKPPIGSDQRADRIRQRSLPSAGAGSRHGRPGQDRCVERHRGAQGAPLVNVSLELSRRMLDLPERQRPLRVQRILERVVAEIDGDIVLLDNIELLFDPSLRQDPLRLLKGISRNRTTVAAWSGSIEDGNIYYAERGHPEYRRYSTDGVLAVGA